MEGNEDRGVRVLVTGSRSWSDSQRVEDSLTEAWHDAQEAYGADSRFTVVHGACPTGADASAARWCETNDVEQEAHPADWNQHGRAAGPIRNREMVDAGADLCVAFAKTGSTGTKGTVRLAEAAGIPVLRWDEGAIEPTYTHTPTGAEQSLTEASASAERVAELLAARESQPQQPVVEAEVTGPGPEYDIEM